MNHTSQTALLLSKLPVGHRVWFWFCPELSNDESILLLSSCKEDPSMTTLSHIASKIPLPLGALPITGFAAANPDGTMMFGSPLLSRAGLERLADWTQSNYSIHKGLSRLKDASFIQVDRKGCVQARHADDSLWESIPSSIVPGTIAQAVQLIKKVRTGHNYWFWMAKTGPDGAPFLYLGSTKKDIGGSVFSSKVLELRRQSKKGAMIQGVLRRLEDHRLLFISPQEITDEHSSLFHLVVETHSETIPDLVSARLVQLHEGSFTRIIGGEMTSVVSDLSKEESLLSSLGEKKVWFWFTESSADGTAVLILDDDRKNLKARAQAVGHSGKRLNGHLRVSSKGWIEFQSKKSYPNFIIDLGQWVMKNHSSAPGLVRLKGARMTQRDENNEIIDRQKNDDIWKSIN